MAKKQEEQVEDLGKLHEVIYHRLTRPNGTRRVSQDFSNCPTKTEHQSAHLTDINWLIKKYKPDELAAYIAARSSYRQEIVGHDFSTELPLMDAKTINYRFNKAYDQLPKEIRIQFSSPLEFLKFIDNPANQEKMIKLGLINEKQIQNFSNAQKSDAQQSDKMQTQKIESSNTEPKAT